MRRIVLAKSHARRRAAMGGGVIFIVALTMSVLTAVGMYALRASSLEIRTAGYERQATQTHYLSEYGVLGATQSFTTSSAQTILNMMMSGTQRDTRCTSLTAPFSVSGISPTALSLACRRMQSSELGSFLLAAPGTVIVAYGGSPSSPGSLGSAPMVGDFSVEFTDPALVKPPAGYDLSRNLRFVEVTVSATGITQPYLVTSNATGTYGSEGLELSRARITGGPLTHQ